MRNKEKEHIPVLLQEVLEYLDVKQGEKYIDATIGLCGHTKEIIKAGGNVLGIDKDKESLTRLKFEIRNSKFEKSKLQLAYGDFYEIGRIAKKHNFINVAGILFDLGLSRWQIEKSGRGFSFWRDEPLDMRIDSGGDVTAADKLNRSTRKELYEIFSKFGEEQHSGRIAHAVFDAHPIETTAQLRTVIEKAISGSNRAKLKTTARIFQALRIAVNEELVNLSAALPQTIDLLQDEGRLLVISFHSLEDRIVKQFFKECVKNKVGELLTRKAVRPSRDEIKRNKRAMSARLRVLKKI